jgi:hypothetical protein
VGSAAVAALGDSFLIGNSFPVLATTDITAVISAGTGGTPCEFRGVYNQVPIPVGMQRAVLVMTNAYQSLAAVVPASGVNVGYSLMPILVSTLQGIAVYNGDTAACTVNFRLTRGSTAFLWNNTVSAPPSRAAFFPVEPLLPGDVFEAKLAAPPNVAGSIILRANFVPSP